MSHIYGCLLLQEVRLFAGEDQYLKQELPHCEIFYNNHPSNTQAHTKNRASTMIIVNRSMFKNHTISPIHLHQDLKGHVQGIHFAPTNSHTHPPFQLFNVYLPSGDYISMKAMMVHMTKFKNGLHTFMGGDFNFVTSLEDTTSSTLPPLGLRDMWGLVMEHLGLSEATQPIHTQYSITKDPASPHNHSGRLDKWFHSFSEGELALLTPVCSIRSRPKIGSLKALSAPPQDHLPIALSYVSTAPPKKRAFPHTPAHIPLSPLFRSVFAKLWFDQEGNLPSPPQRWRVQNELIRKVAKEVAKLEKPDKSELATYSGLITVIRLLSITPTPDIEQAKAVISRFSLQPLSYHHDNTPNTHPYLKSLNILIKKHGEAEPVDADFVLPPTDPPVVNLLDPARSHTRPNFVKKAKVFLPSTRKRLRALRSSLDDPPSDSPLDMGVITKGFWGGLWEEVKLRPGSKRDRLLKKLMRKYKKRIDLGRIQLPDIEMVTRIILKSGDSSAGPDGIPFSAYRALVDIVAPNLLELILFLMEGNPPPPDFNFGLLHLLPKLDTFLIKDTRPITVTNAGNRLLASVLVECITPALQVLIDKRQKMFLPPRQMTDHVRDLNDKFYSSLSKKEQMLILFVDNSKAFDSIHQTFIKDMLSLVGFPAWVRNIINALLTEVEVSPVLANDASLRIKIRRGVKQGCPLSPLLFILVNDMLVSALTDLPASELAIYAAADDLAIGTPKHFLSFIN
jgi:hypothetical protein